MPEWLIVLAIMNKATLKWLWTSSGVNLCFHFSVGNTDKLAFVCVWTGYLPVLCLSF